MKEETKIKGSIDPVDISNTKKILNQMINSICKIKINNAIGTGFFCKIKFDGNYSMNFLMTNYRIFNENYFKKHKKLDLLLNDDNEIVLINLNIKRNIFYNKEKDITLIELKEEDKIKEYLELDDNLFKYKEPVFYENKSIYILGYPNGKNACVSFGILNKIYEYDILHTCSVETGFSGSPILDLKNNKVIGINKGGESNSKNFNNGTFLKCILKLFFQKYEYQIIKELGKGQFGKVNKVLSKSDNKYYALKEISIKGESQDKINNIKKEAEILSKFNSNNIVKYYDSFEDNGKFYILMEYCKGQNLKSFINEFKMKDELIEENILFYIIKQIC